MDSWWVAVSRCRKFLLSVVTPKVIELERRFTAQIKAHGKSVSECTKLFNFLLQKAEIVRSEVSDNV